MGNKTYAVAQCAQVMKLNDIAKHMSSHSSKYNKGDVMAVLTQMSDCLREQLLLGNKVSLGDMGSFSLVLIGDGADNAKSFSTSLIKKVKVRWEPSDELSDLAQSAEYTYVGTRESQRETRKAERARLNRLATVKPETDNPSDSDTTPDEDGNLRV